MYEKFIVSKYHVFTYVCVCVCTCTCVCMQSLQSCPTLCIPVDYSPSGSSVHGVLWARILEWVPYPPPGDFPSPETKSGSPAAPAVMSILTAESPGNPICMCIYSYVKNKINNCI